MVNPRIWLELYKVVIAAGYGTGMYFSGERGNDMQEFSRATDRAYREYEIRFAQTGQFTIPEQDQP